MINVIFYYNHSHQLNMQNNTCSDVCSCSWDFMLYWMQSRQHLFSVRLQALESQKGADDSPVKGNKINNTGNTTNEIRLLYPWHNRGMEWWSRKNTEAGCSEQLRFVLSWFLNAMSIKLKEKNVTLTFNLLSVHP